MKLEGSLDAFSLPDVFQLLSFTKKTGGLHLAVGGAEGVVFFSAGQVTGASADSSRQPLARRLVGSGVVFDEALAAALEAVNAGEGIGVVRALAQAEAIDAAVLHQAAAEQVLDAVFDLLRWENGDFAFVMDEPNPDEVGVSLPVESLLADAEARKGTWESVSQAVPSSAAVPSMRLTLDDDPVVSREEWALLALVDGRRSVGELVDLTGSGSYAVVTTVAALVQRGLLEVRLPVADRPPTVPDDQVADIVRRQQLLTGLEVFVPVVDAAPAPAAEDSRQAPPATSVPAPSEAPADSTSPVMLGGAHVPEDVVPPRPEPFLPRRQAEFDEIAADSPVRPVGRPVGLAPSAGSPIGDVVGATATAPDETSPVIERDPNVNRSLMLRLIAGVRGL